jgi:hypothetical protein
MFINIFLFNLIHLNSELAIFQIFIEFLIYFLVKIH